MAYVDVLPLVIIVGGFLIFAVTLAAVAAIEHRHAGRRDDRRVS